MTKNIETIPLRRKREGKTNYKKRLALLKSKELRLVVRRSNKHMSAQLVKYSDNGDVVVESAHTRNLVKFGWDTSTSNIPAAYLVGLLLGTKAKGKKAILDLGLQTPISGSKIFAVLKGASDGGLKIGFSEEVVPTNERLTGVHISKYAEVTKDDRLFSNYLKGKKDPKKIMTYLSESKQKILQGAK